MLIPFMPLQPRNHAKSENDCHLDVKINSKCKNSWFPAINNGTCNTLKVTTQLNGYGRGTVRSKLSQQHNKTTTHNTTSVSATEEESENSKSIWDV